MISIGRKPFTQNLNIEAINISKTANGKINVDGKFETSVQNIYAIGDVIKGPMLAHKAEEDGIALAEILAGKNVQINYDNVPSVIYTHPEVAWCGKTEDSLQKSQIDYIKGSFPFIANSRAKTVDDTDGIVKILCEKSTDKIIGAHIIGPNAGEMIAEISLAMQYGASSEDISRTYHAHPVRYLLTLDI